MENNSSRSYLKAILRKGSSVETSSNFSVDVMTKVLAYEQKKSLVLKYIKISLILIVLAIPLGVHVIQLLSSITCSIVNVYCKPIEYVFLGLLATVLLLQFNFLVTNFHKAKKSLVA